MLIAVPSKGRAGLTTTNKVLKNAVFYVPKSEEHQYIGTVKNIVTVPNEIQGITKTRNWIMKNTEDKKVVFIDDDVKNAGWTKMEKRKSKKIDIKNEKFWINEFEKYFDLCDNLGYKIWGVKTEAAPRSVYPYKPILLRAYITASCMGIINDGEYYFDESYEVKEDYEICLRHIVEKGGILAIRYLHWENSHWNDEGGCKSYRTVNIEEKCIRQLIKQYPSLIRLVTRKASNFTIQLNL